MAQHPFVQTVFIIEMDAGTGELYFKDLKTTSLGSAGHSLDLRYNSSKNYARKLNVILVEEDRDCIKHMKKVIRRRWPSAVLSKSVGKSLQSQDDAVILYDNIKNFLSDTNSGEQLGISLFYFDPLLSVDWRLLERIAKSRITEPYKKGTEFLVFFFTSDWITGRNDPYFHALPKSNVKEWTQEEMRSGVIADRTFGGRDWLPILTSNVTKKEMEKKLVELYKKKLRKWFRFVIPLPFVPKKGQVYHVFCCSNFDVGMSVVRSIYTKYMQPYGLSAENTSTYREFERQHSSLTLKYSGKRKPPEWKLLWHVMRNCPDGLCDSECENLHSIANGIQSTRNAIHWLEKEGYLRKIKISDWPWTNPKFPVYEIDWEIVKLKLKVDAPSLPVPLTPP